MVDSKLLLLLEAHTVFSEWETNLKLYSFLILIMILVYFVIFHVIRFAMSLKLIQTLTYIITILLLVIGIYVYTNVVDGVQIKHVFKLVFESITIFGGLLFFLMLFRTLIRKIKT